MGAIGTIAVMKQLNAAGHQVIEFERYSTSNKIWETKVKRLRVPDLLCLRCGERFESRAKSKLGIIMSDSPSSDERHWDHGLRSEDSAVFLACHQENGQWIPAPHIYVYRIGQLQQSLKFSRLGLPKSQSEGSERDRMWPSKVPSYSGIIQSVAMSKDGTSKVVQILKDNHKRQSARIPLEFVVNVRAGERILANSSIIAAVVASRKDFTCVSSDYNFIHDLTYGDDEVTQFAAIKALGYLPSTSGTAALVEFIENHPIDVGSPYLQQQLLILDALASLIRGNTPHASDSLRKLRDIIFHAKGNASLQMESVLILGELVSSDTTEAVLTILLEIGTSTQLASEVRAAAVWYATTKVSLDNLDRFVPFLADTDDIVRLHAIAGMQGRLTAEMKSSFLPYFNEDGYLPGSLVALISHQSEIFVPDLIGDLLHNKLTTKQADWILYLLGRIPHGTHLTAEDLPEGHRSKIRFLRHTLIRDWLEDPLLQQDYHSLLQQRILESRVDP